MIDASRARPSCDFPVDGRKRAKRPCLAAPSVAASPSGVADALAKPGVQVWFLPPYSPELSAVEECGSKVKTLVRGAEPRSVSDLIDALGNAIGKVTAQDARGWFSDARHARVARPKQQHATARGAASSPATDLRQDSG